MRRVTWSAFAVVVLSVLTGGCQQAGSVSDQDKAAIQKAHDEFARMFAAEKPDPAGLVAMYYADDATVLPPNMPAANGKDAIIAAFTAMGGVKTFKNGPLTISGSGDMAFVNATFDMTMAVPVTGEVVADKGKYLEVWKKQSDGSWKAIRDMWSSDEPPPGLALPTGGLKADASAELKALDWMAGHWTWEGEAKVASPFGPPGKSTMAMDCRWFSGGQHLFCGLDGSTPGGPYHDLMVYTYDADAKAHRGFDIDSTGMATQFGVSLGKTEWAFTYDLKFGGKPVKMRMTLFDMTADGCRFKQELAAGGGPSTLIMEGSAKKQK
jgi:ketosteroid isomerase-like protein